MSALLKTVETSRNWVELASQLAEEFAGRAASHDEEESFVAENFARLHELGFFTAMVPAEFGGGGASVSEMCAAIRRLGAGCGSTALAFAMHSHLVAAAAWRWRHQNAPTDGLLRRVVAEKLVLVSSGGSDWLASGGTAVRVNGGFRITARKPFSSGSPVGDLLSTSAIFDDPAEGPTVLHFAVSLKAEGVSLCDTWHVLGMRGTGSYDIELNQVFVPDAAIAGRRPAGKWHMLFHVISKVAFALIYAAYVGVAEGARAQALALARGKACDPDVQLLAGEMDRSFAIADMALRQMCELADFAAPGPETTSRAMICRTIVSRAAIETVERAMELAGGRAFYRAAGLERAFRDIQGARYHPLQEKPQQRLTGRLALGLDIDG